MTQLVCDLGATHARFALAERDLSSWKLAYRLDLPAKKFQTFGTALQAYQDHLVSSFLKIEIETVSVAIPGPVHENHAYATNLGWRVSHEEIKVIFPSSQVFLWNDLESWGYGLSTLQEDHILPLRPLKKDSLPSHCAIIAPGTGLGECHMHYVKNRFQVVRTEGGHTTFCPEDDFGWFLAQKLTKKYNGHVSWERIISGQEGFLNIYEALKGFQGLKEGIPALEQLEADISFGATIAQFAAEGHPLAQETIQRFVAYTAREAGNLVLKTGAFSGLFIGGGIAPKLKSWFQKGFLQHFEDKGRFQALLAEVPVFIVVDAECGLKGAAEAVYRSLE